MQIVIEIPENDYNQIREYYEKNEIVEATYSYIYHGTVLPENHGRLIDADEAKNTMMDVMCGTGYQTQAMNVVGSEFYTPTILEETEGKE